MSVAGVHKLWNFFLTALRAVRAAACERAADLIPDRAWNVAGEGQTLFFIKGAFRRDRGEKRLSVRLLRICVDSLRSVELHDTSQIHDHDPVAGDYISTSSGEGTVESIGLVYTTLLTTDNRVITIPNSSVSSAPLTNLTRTGKRRLIINVGIGYSSDLLKAKNVLKKIFEENPGIMKDQPVQVVVDALGDSSVVLSARGWTTCEDYWTAKWPITEAIKLTFDKEGIEIPYQYMNVMMTKES